MSIKTFFIPNMNPTALEKVVTQYHDNQREITRLNEDIAAAERHLASCRAVVEHRLNYNHTLTKDIERLSEIYPVKDKMGIKHIMQKMQIHSVLKFPRAEAKS